MAVKKKTLQALLVGAVVGVLFAVLVLTGALDSLEWRIDDALVRATASPEAASPEVALILLDQASLDWGEEAMGLSWPWPRELYGALTSFAAAGGAKALGFDVIYSEASLYSVYDDEAYIYALEDYGRGVGTVFLSARDGETSWPADLPAPAGDSEAGGLSELPYAQFPIPEIGSRYAALANVQVPGDADGVFRRVPPAVAFDGMAVPSMALALYRVGGAGEGVITGEKGKLELDGRRLPVDREGNLALRYRGPSGTHATYSAAEVIKSQIQIMSGEEPQLDPVVFDGKYVLFGYSAPGLKDLRPSPMGETYSGVEIHATMLDNLLTGDFLLPVADLGPAWALLAAVLLIAVALAAALAVVSVQGFRNSLLVFLAVLAGVLIITVPPFFLAADLPVLPAFLTALVSMTGAFILNYATEGKRGRLITSLFGQFMSSDYVSILIENGRMPELGGEERALTIFFSDLQGFTTISEGLSAPELTALLNTYLTPMSRIIMEEGGTIDKFEGDAIIAFWNAPLDLEDHAVRGIRASLRCQEVLADMQGELKAMAGGKDVLMRIGMNTGPAVVGNMGSVDRFDYTMLGDAVNLAARLEGVNKQFGTYTMISQATLDAARGKGFEPFVRELARVEVVGKSEPVTVYEPMTKEDWEEGVDLWRPFAEALSLFYEGRLSEARAGFAALADRDPAAAKYAAKIDSMSGQAPDGWKGVWVMTSK